MKVRFADSYVDQIFADRDLVILYLVIEAIGQDRPLPEEFCLFRRIYEWAPQGVVFGSIMRAFR